MFKFGEKADYWEIYNEVTDTFDEDMMERLHIGLDNLLIFVSAGYTLRKDTKTDFSNRPVSFLPSILRSCSPPWVASALQHPTKQTNSSGSSSSPPTAPSSSHRASTMQPLYLLPA